MWDEGGRLCGGDKRENIKKGGRREEEDGEVNE